MINTYDETIDFLFSQLPMYQRIGPVAMKKDLTNIKQLVSFLKHPHKSFPNIHIAGTNGKGTTAHLIASILQNSGLKVGLYTSPHYLDYRERIKINGNIIPKDYVTDFVKRIRQGLPDIKPSFFEFSVALAFDYFNTENIDIAVIETGLGGRLDSTNIIDPILSIITNISLDHQAMLGNSEYLIAIEKAGIIKSEIPIVVGRHQNSSDQVFIKKAHEMNSNLSFASLNWITEKVNGHYKFSSKDLSLSYEITLPEESPFIAENIVTTLEAIRVLNNNSYSLSTQNIVEGIKNYKVNCNYIGRWHIFKQTPLVIADSAHNSEAIERVLNYIYSLNYKNIHFVLGFLKDKDVDNLLSLFRKEDTYYFTKPSVVRGLKVDKLFEKGQKLQLSGKLFPNVKEAIYAAFRIATKDDLIFIGGSSFIVADALETLNK